MMVAAKSFDRHNPISKLNLQAALEQYLRALRERIPAMIELKGALPTNFWTQEEKTLANMLLRLKRAKSHGTQWARP